VVPPPDTCAIVGGAPSPGCSRVVTSVVDGSITRAPGPADTTPTDDQGAGSSGFGRWGGREGAAMCFSAASDGTVRRVAVRDTARPQGFDVDLHPLGPGGTNVVVAAVGAGPVTVTGFDAAGTVVAELRVP
jgi:hypothetical protein